MKQDGRWQKTRYIVSDDPAFVYFVIPKVACSSIKTTLLPTFGMEEPPDRAYGVHALFNGTPHQIDKAALLDGGAYRDHFSFAFVRNPWDRLVSCWSQKFAPGRRGEGVGRRYREGRLRVGMGFEEFAENVCKIPDESANPHF